MDTTHFVSPEASRLRDEIARAKDLTIFSNQGDTSLKVSFRDLKNVLSAAFHSNPGPSGGKTQMYLVTEHVMGRLQSVNEKLRQSNLESLSARTLDPEIDTWALGASLYYMMTETLLSDSAKKSQDGMVKSCDPMWMVMPLGLAVISTRHPPVTLRLTNSLTSFFIRIPRNAPQWMSC
ncbi:hypothetical protein [Rhizobium oryzicola]|uniref:Protein kinase domain-containing protein n=1 Tax=Rhizobium oryzicola TaxID=1232668 RepID=A0ABT8SXW8_9HYPH|nr:hypothetical protein [Rhizobium oryzicola]MDO1583201.1 hypothetical protein [Rhizobium oryzicola]